MTVKTLILLLCFVPVLAFGQSDPNDPNDPTHVTGSSNGPAIDRNQNPVVDPTKNVLDLVRALERRLDDVSNLTNKGIEDRFRYREEITNLQSAITDLKTSHNAEITKLRGDYQQRADDKESERIDAIIVSDRAAAKNEVDRSQKAVDTVATLQTATAETLRSAVATTAAGIATQFAQTTSALVERIAALEKASYTGQGRSTVADPQVEALRLQVESQRAQVESLNRIQAQGTGKSEGFGSSWAIVLGVGSLIGVLIALAGLVAVIVTRTRKSHVTSP